MQASHRLSYYETPHDPIRRKVCAVTLQKLRGDLQVLTAAPAMIDWTPDVSTRNSIHHIQQILNRYLIVGKPDATDLQRVLPGAETYMKPNFPTGLAWCAMGFCRR
jgi:hypothetical protein